MNRHSMVIASRPCCNSGSCANCWGVLFLEDLILNLNQETKPAGGRKFCTSLIMSYVQLLGMS